MGRIIALDYGKARTGIAVTDDLHLIASGLRTVETQNLMDFLIDYGQNEKLDLFVIGQPKQMNNLPSESENIIKPFIVRLSEKFPDIPIERQDERFTSKMATRSLVESGIKKKRRQDKSLIDEVSAVLILQAYLSKLKK
ncbi:MAG: Holliday junction resolvase RuvX [Flavobacteriaceae bacterium]